MTKTQTKKPNKIACTCVGGIFLSLVDFIDWIFRNKFVVFVCVCAEILYSGTDDPAICWTATLDRKSTTAPKTILCSSIWHLLWTIHFTTMQYSLCKGFFCRYFDGLMYWMWASLRWLKLFTWQWTIVFNSSNLREWKSRMQYLCYAQHTCTVYCARNCLLFEFTLNECTSKTLLTMHICFWLFFQVQAFCISIYDFKKVTRFNRN